MQAMALVGDGSRKSFRLETRGIPEPGPGQVRIRVAAAGVNRPDIYQRKGNYPPPAWAPQDIPGLEVAGIIEALGADVDPQLSDKKVCALVVGGGYATHVLAEAGHCLEIPQGWSYIEAASLPETVFTVWHNVFQRGRLKAGEGLLVHGGSSGIGITAIQLATALGAKVYATAGNPVKCAACEDLGAIRCLDYKKQDFVSELGKEEIDVILDMVGGDYISKNLSLLNEEGRLIFINTMQGSKAEIDFGLVMRRRLHISGSTLRNRSNIFKTQLTQEIIANVWPLLISGKFKPIIFQDLPLSAAQEAHQILEESQHIGKVILTIPGFSH